MAHQLGAICSDWALSGTLAFRAFHITPDYLFNFISQIPLF